MIGLKMIVNEARGLLDELDRNHPMMKVRVVVEVKEDEAEEFMKEVKEMGCKANLQSTAYGDIEVVITEVPDDGVRSTWT